MATRAAQCSSQERSAASSTSSSSSSPSSGRERRRAGKMKMLYKIAELKATIVTLHGIIAAMQEGSTSETVEHDRDSLIFDLYNLADADVAEASTQTEHTDDATDVTAEPRRYYSIGANGLPAQCDRLAFERLMATPVLQPEARDATTASLGTAPGDAAAGHSLDFDFVHPNEPHPQAVILRQGKPTSENIPQTCEQVVEPGKLASYARPYEQQTRQELIVLSSLPPWDPEVDFTAQIQTCNNNRNCPSVDTRLSVGPSTADDSQSYTQNSKGIRIDTPTSPGAVADEFFACPPGPAEAPNAQEQRDFTPQCSDDLLFAQSHGGLRTDCYPFTDIFDEPLQYRPSPQPIGALPSPIAGTLAKSSHYGSGHFSGPLPRSEVPIGAPADYHLQQNDDLPTGFSMSHLRDASLPIGAFRDFFDAHYEFPTPISLCGALADAEADVVLQLLGKHEGDDGDISTTKSLGPSKAPIALENTVPATPWFVPVQPTIALDTTPQPEVLQLLRTLHALRHTSYAKTITPFVQAAAHVRNVTALNALIAEHHCLLEDVISGAMQQGLLPTSLP